MSRIGKSIEVENRLVIVRGWKKERMGRGLLMGMGFLLGGNEIFWNQRVVIHSQLCEYNKKPLNF